MTNSKEWQRVGRALADRIDELSLTTAEVIRASGVSDKTLARYLAGMPIRRADKERGLCAALGWTADSIGRVRRGQKPRLVGVTPTGDVPDRLRAVEDRLHAVGDLAARLDRIEAKLAAVLGGIDETLEDD